MKNVLVECHVKGQSANTVSVRLSASDEPLDILHPTVFFPFVAVTCGMYLLLSATFFAD